MHINKNILFDRNLLAFLYKNWATKLQGWANLVISDLDFSQLSRQPHRPMLFDFHYRFHNTYLKYSSVI